MQEKMRNHLKRALEQNHTYCVLITCTTPNEKGDMQVEFNYDGELPLTAYLLQGAQAYVDEQQDNEISLERS